MSYAHDALEFYRSWSADDSLTPKPVMLFYHFFCVAFYSIWILLTSGLPATPGKSKPKTQGKPGLLDTPFLMFMSVRVVSCARGRPLAGSTSLMPVLDGVSCSPAGDMDRDTRVGAGVGRGAQGLQAMIVDTYKWHYQLVRACWPRMNVHNQLPPSLQIDGRPCIAVVWGDGGQTCIPWWIGVQLLALK